MLGGESVVCGTKSRAFQDMNIIQKKPQGVGV